MEIGEWLRARRWRLPLLLLLPLLAAGVAVWLVSTQPQPRGATATVEVPALVGTPGGLFPGSSGTDQYVEAYLSAATGPTVRRAAAEATGLDLAVVEDGLDVRRAAGSSRVLVRFEAPRGTAPAEADAVVPAVLAEVTAATADELFGEPVRIAEDQLEAARGRFAEASARVSAVGADEGVADPRQAYSSQLSLMNSLRTQTASAEARGDGTGALEDAAEEAQAGLEAFAPLLAELDTLEGEQDVAESRLQGAQEDLDDLRAEQTAADTARTTSTGPVGEPGLRALVLDVVLPAAAGGLVLAVLLLLLLEALPRRDRRGRRDRRRGRPARAAAPRADDAAPAEDPVPAERR
ncbi:hypothetical protein [Pseudokineococcus lusitanus]|uniref:Subunit length determinant protein n=1 Tax=Pseudokineococcus lusitanus TaxID=763993 RepID=A0A3N1HKP0_9ACTN|nr:hypothetical protein [Pseudokineococcus lusitanus]ROP43021.1 hypothetical protein EDC03_2317 [Pseudokineococcus lusitanus]